MRGEFTNPTAPHFVLQERAVEFGLEALSDNEALELFPCAINRTWSSDMGPRLAQPVGVA